MVVGYNTELPIYFSRRCRDLIRSPEYKALFPHTALDEESKAVDHWRVTQGGSYRAVGVSAGQTGLGAHCLIIDDPIKNIEEADSSLIRDKLWDWYQSTAYTRLAPGGGVLVIQTRWHYDDLAGRLLTPDAHDKFKVVRYPALAEEYEYWTPTQELVTSTVPLHSSDPSLTLLRQPGDPLHPDRYDKTQLEAIRATLQPRLWASLYQQRPSPEEGAIFTREMFKFCPSATPTLSPTTPHRVLITVDFAIGQKQQNDFSVIAVLYQTLNDEDLLYVADIKRFKAASLDIVEAILDTLRHYRAHPSSSSSQRRYVLLGVEDGQIWRSIKPLFQKRQREERLYVPLQELKPLTDKVARARPLQGRMQQGRVIFPRSAPWLAEAQSELLTFPAGVHDDIVDALAWGAHLALLSPSPSAGRPQASPSASTSTYTSTSTPTPSWLRGVIQGGKGGHMAA
jgi:predicted phage terminase large subunit-like protein